MSNTAIDKTTLTYGYVYNVNTIRATDIDGGEHHLVNLRHDYSPAIGVVAYAYLLDDISDTMGLQAKGKVAGSDAAFLYHVEYAAQTENGIASAYEADYYLLEGGVDVKGVTIYVTLATAKLGPAMMLTWHDFGTDFGGADYGSEIDFSVAQTFDGTYTALLQLDEFSFDNVAFPNTTKIWVQLEAAF